MKIAIIGGGAAGLMAAAAIVENSPQTEVLLIDKNPELGKKVMISGGGRCNVTTGLRDVRQVLTRYPRGGKFLNSVMRRFSPEFVYNWFEARGVPLKTEKDNRVFPQSNNGRDIVTSFERLFADGHVRTLMNSYVAAAEKTSTGFRLIFKDGERLDVDKLILTTGGQAYRLTGSVGEGYVFAESLGHTITPLAPSLSAFYSREIWPREVSGLSFQNARLAVMFDKEYEFTGPFLFTHRGVSGPAVFALSSLVAFQHYDQDRPMKLSIDLWSDVPADELLKRIETAMRTNAKKSAVNVLDFFMPKTLAAIVCREIGIDGNRHAGEIAVKDMERAAAWLKAVPLHIIGRDAGEEFVTAGGVDTDEVDQRTMESKITPGLYFAGEILNVDGFTGGFNLQASWATGRAAGEAASK